MEATSTVKFVSVTMVGGATVVLDVGGVRVITDPTFDPPGERAPGRPFRVTPPALGAQEIGPVDVALVSHDQHPDNLDTSGRAFLADVPLVLTTTEGAQRLGGSSKGLAPYQETTVRRPDGGNLRITALPAQHGPPGAEAQSGPVIGFLLTGEDLPAIYVSGDNASVDVVREITTRVGQVDIAVLFAGAARVPYLWDGALLTLSSTDAVAAAGVLGARAVVPVHCEGWTHWSQDSAALTVAFEAAGMGDRLVVVPAGSSVEL